MPGQGITLDACLIIDNSLLVTLQEYWCDRMAIKYAGAQRHQAHKAWIAEMLQVLRQFTPDGNLHCVDCVAAEFKPEGGRMGRMPNIRAQEINELKQFVNAQLEQSCIEDKDIGFLRGLPAAPRKLVGNGGLSNNDLTLVALGAQMTENQPSVYLLSHDQDLLAFTSFVRMNTSAKARWSSISRLQGLHGLTFLEQVHRNCKIQTPEMHDILQFAFTEHFMRTDLAGTQKGFSIVQQLNQVSGNLLESAQIKAILKAGTVS